MRLLDAYVECTFLLNVLLRLGNLFVPCILLDRFFFFYSGWNWTVSTDSQASTWCVDVIWSTLSCLYITRAVYSCVQRIFLQFPMISTVVHGTNSLLVAFHTETFPRLLEMQATLGQQDESCSLRHFPWIAWRHLLHGALSIVDLVWELRRLYSMTPVARKLPW